MGQKRAAAWHGTTAEVRSFEARPHGTVLAAYCPQHGVVGTLWAVRDSRYPGPANRRARVDAHDHNNIQHPRSTMPIVPDPTPQKWTKRRNSMTGWFVAFSFMAGAACASTGWLIAERLGW